MEENSPEEILRRYLSWREKVDKSRASEMYSDLWYDVDIRNITHNRLTGCVKMHLIPRTNPVEIEFMATDSRYASEKSELERIVLEEFSGKSFEEAVLEMEAAGG